MVLGLPHLGIANIAYKIGILNARDSADNTPSGSPHSKVHVCIAAYGIIVLSVITIFFFFFKTRDLLHANFLDRKSAKFCLIKLHEKETS